MFLKDGTFVEEVYVRPETRLKGGHVIDPKMTALVAGQFSEIVGVKLAHYHGHDWEPYRRAVEAGDGSMMLA